MYPAIIIFPLNIVTRFYLWFFFKLWYFHKIQIYEYNNLYSSNINYFLFSIEVYFSNISSKKISKSLRFLIIFGLIILAVLFAIGGKFLLTLPLTLASLALIKLKGLSIFQLISLFRLIQTLRRSGRFSFNQSSTNNNPTISIQEAYKILNLDMKKKLLKKM